MVSRRIQDSPYPTTLLSQYLRDEIEVGIAMADDPANANLPDLARRVTTINSPWYTRTCRICKHKFREGDWVRLCPQCDEPYHDDDQYELHCWQKKFAGGHVCTEGGVDRFSGLEIPRCGFTWSGSLPDKSDPGRPVDGTARPDVAPAVSLLTQFVGAALGRAGSGRLARGLGRGDGWRSCRRFSGRFSRSRFCGCGRGRVCLGLDRDRRQGQADEPQR